MSVQKESPSHYEPLRDFIEQRLDGEHPEENNLQPAENNQRLPDSPSA
jgi:hypothetical protein